MSQIPDCTTPETRSVLFVDDDGNVLRGLERMLRPLRREWTMTFVGGGADALDALDRAPYDVLVTDIRMPGMNGVELMQQVLERFPRVIRIALSGNAERDAVVRAVRLAHQYLAKPCDADLLKEKLAQAIRLRATLESPTLQGILTRVDGLRSVPTIYLQLVAETQLPEPSMRRVAELVAADPAMTAKVLQIINSAYFGLRADVSDPERAVQLLGFETVTSLVLSTKMFSQFQKPGATSPEHVSQHGLRTARIARAIAARIGLEQRYTQEAFTAALLHDVGKLVLSEAIPEYDATMAGAAARGDDPLSVEQEAFGANHAEVGSYLFGLWGLPFGIVEAVAWHHRPLGSGIDGRSPLTAVHAANVIDHLVRAVPDARYAPDEKYLASLGLTDAFPDWMRRIVEQTAA